MNSTVCNLVEPWPGEITIITDYHGRACQPQSQGLVERGKSKVEEMLACHFNTSCSGGASLGQHSYLRFSVSLNFSACKCDLTLFTFALDSTGYACTYC